MSLFYRNAPKPYLDESKLNEQQKILARAAYQADRDAWLDGEMPTAQLQLEKHWAQQEALRTQLDQQQAEQGGRAFAAGGNVSPAQAVAAMRTGQPYDISMLLDNQAALIDKPTRIEMGSRYGSLSDLTSLYNATKPNLQVTPTGEVADFNDPSLKGRVFPKVGEGQRVDPATGSVVYDPNYIRSRTQMEGGVAGAQAEARNASDYRYAGPKAAAEAQGRATTELIEVTVPGKGKTLVPKLEVLGRGGMRSAPDELQVKLDTETLTSGQKTMAEAAGQLPYLEQAVNLSRSVDSGKSQSFFLPMRQFAAGLGFTVDPNLPEVEQFKAAVSFLVPRMRPEGSGSSSDFDALMYQAAAPGFEKTPGGNQLIATAMYQTAKWNIEKARAQRAYYDQKGTLAGFNPDAEVGLVFPKPQTPEDRDSLKPGTLYIAPDGSFNIKR